MKPTVQERLYSEFLKTRMSVGEFLDRSGLDVDRSTASRKIRSKAPMTTSELEAFAKAIDREVRLVPRKRAA